MRNIEKKYGILEEAEIVHRFEKEHTHTIVSKVSPFPCKRILNTRVRKV